MKKTISLLLALGVLMSASAACSYYPTDPVRTQPEETTASVTGPEDTAAPEPDNTPNAATEPEELPGERPTDLTDILSFTAQTAEGKAFGPSDLAECDLTVINIWATFCGPCRDEMPGLASLEKSLPDNVRFITFCLDADTEEETMRAILDDAGFTGTTLVSGSGDLALLANQVMYIPTTVFVDSTGRMVLREQIGSPISVEDSYRAAINEALAAMGKGSV